MARKPRTKKQSLLKSLALFFTFIAGASIPLYVYMTHLEYHREALTLTQDPTGLDISLIVWATLLFLSPLITAMCFIEEVVSKKHSAFMQFSFDFLLGLTLTTYGLHLFQKPYNAGWNIRIDAYKSYFQELQPVVDAIEDYERNRGRPPKDLSILVPEYISAIPAVPFHQSDLSYRSLKGLPQNQLNRYDGTRWVLSILASHGAQRREYLIYYPEQNYPDKKHIWFEEIDGWAYGHR